MVEHESIPKVFTMPKYTQEEISYIYQEIDYLLSIGEKEVFHTKIENAANKWREDKQKNL